MTRKDYVALAEALREVRPTPAQVLGYETAMLTWTDCTGTIADVLADDNPRFDRERFIKACQGEK